MLSRRIAILPTTVEDRDGRAHGGGCTISRSRQGSWWAAALLVVVFAQLGVIVFLNRGAVVEPRLDFMFAGFERPSLLVVLLTTSIVSAAGALTARAALLTMKQARDERHHRVAVPLQPPPLMRNVPALAQVVPVS
jgi:hypothetical protein